MAQIMNHDKAKEILQNVDNFLFDCDGVLWDGSGPIDGSLETVLKLKKLGKKVFYVTNNSSKTRRDYVNKCKEYGYPAQEDEIVCTAYIAAQYLASLNFKDKVYVIGKQESLGTELDQAGIRYIGPGPEPFEGKLSDWLKMKLDPQPDSMIGSSYEDWLRLVELDPEVKCVLVGFDPHFNYMKMMKAASYLKNPDILYLATNEDGSLPVKDTNICIPGTGCMVLPVTLAAARNPMVMGKPSTNMFEVLKKVHNLDPSKCMMTGDRMDTDILFAKTCGLRSFLVLSGINTSDDLKSAEKEKSTKIPDFYASNLAELGKYI